MLFSELLEVPTSTSVLFISIYLYIAVYFLKKWNNALLPVYFSYNPFFFFTLSLSLLITPLPYFPSLSLSLSVGLSVYLKVKKKFFPSPPSISFMQPFLFSLFSSFLLFTYIFPPLLSHVTPFSLARVWLFSSNEMSADPMTSQTLNSSHEKYEKFWFFFLLDFLFIFNWIHIGRKTFSSYVPYPSLSYWLVYRSIYLSCWLEIWNLIFLLWIKLKASRKILYFSKFILNLR